MRVFTSAQQLLASRGEEIGEGAPLLITQEMVDTFAHVTGDVQWIHCDPERAAQSELGGTIAHGFMSLALIPSLDDEILEVRGFRRALNYGLNRVRFISPIRVGSTITLRTRISFVQSKEAGTLVTFGHEIWSSFEERTAQAVLAEHLTLFVW